MGDRIAVMRKGVLQQIGTPEELYTRPANTFVATFIGSPAMNLRSRPGSWVSARDSLLAGFRPEHIRVGSAHGRQLRLRGRGRGRRVPRRRAPRAPPPRRALARGEAAGRRAPRARDHRQLCRAAPSGAVLRRRVGLRDQLAPLTDPTRAPVGAGRGAGPRPAVAHAAAIAQEQRVRPIQWSCLPPWSSG